MMVISQGNILDFIFKLSFKSFEMFIYSNYLYVSISISLQLNNENIFYTTNI